MKTCPHAEGNSAIDSVVSILKLKYFLIQKCFALKQKGGVGEIGKEKQV